MLFKLFNFTFKLSKSHYIGVSLPKTIINILITAYEVRVYFFYTKEFSYFYFYNNKKLFIEVIV